MKKRFAGLCFWFFVVGTVGFTVTAFVAGCSINEAAVRARLQAELCEAYPEVCEYIDFDEPCEDVEPAGTSE